MIAHAVARGKNVVAQAKLGGQRLAIKFKSVNRRASARSEQVNRIALALGFEKLPDGANFHELGSSDFGFFHVAVEFERAGIAVRESLFKIAAEAHVATEEHVRIDVAPHFAQIRHNTNFLVEIRDGKDRQIGAGARRTLLSGKNKDG